MTTNCDIRSMLSVFFPFWRILSDGMPWILLTAVLSLLLDGAVLIFVLLVCRPRRGRIGDADVGNVWRRTVLPFFALDTLASLTGAGILRLSLWLTSRILGKSTGYFTATAAQSPCTDLLTLIPVILGILTSALIIYLIGSRVIVIFKDIKKARLAALVLALTSAPYSLLFPSVFNK